MTKSIHSAVLALENVYQRLYHIEAATALLQGIEHGEIEDLEHTVVDFTTLTSEALNDAMSGIFDDCEEIEGYLETQGGGRFLNLVENAKGADLTQSSDESGAGATMNTESISATYPDDKEKLDKTLLEVEQQLVESVSLLTALETADFDLKTTPCGATVDTAIWNDVMAIIRKQVREASEKLEPYFHQVRDRVQEKEDTEEDKL
ncbi:MAG: hypothetical protein KUF79_17475 [Candidatus Thiodiazotropha sp. (ex Ctena orbiculata)]|nr:hypothetical protein [Candidatus Thiodiazotropha taylori]